MNDNPFTLFYAWQSDIPAKIGRNFIENAVSKALKTIHSSGVLDLAPRLEKDTKDIPGMPDIANTILEKIRASSVILADLTFVGREGNQDNCKDKQKLLPNPNVLLELGYAISHLGWERVICVMNTHYGNEAQLPFDLRHRRWPISFQLHPDTDEKTRRKVKQDLVKSIESAISGIAELPPLSIVPDTNNRLKALEHLVSSMSGPLGQISEMRSAIDQIQHIIVKEEENKHTPEYRVKTELNNMIENIKNQSFEDISYQQGMLGIAILPCKPVEENLPLFQKEDIIKRQLSADFGRAWTVVSVFSGQRFRV
jgi:hypothetical protein